MLPTPSSSNVIQDGDLVIVYESIIAMKAIYVDKKASFSNKYGGFAHKEWIGKPFGTKVRGKPASKGAAGRPPWVYLLRPTPELWTQVLKHRTQILYAADIALVCMLLELRPGSLVLESGTGSGSLTHSLARAVGPNGGVRTFEFHAGRAAEAEREFGRHGLAEVVKVTHRDIEGLGFPEELHGQADAVFLDLPGPWKVVESAAHCLRPDGRFCAFSPCIEQVQRTCSALREAGFRSLRTVECLLRNIDVTPVPLQTSIILSASHNVGGPVSRRQAKRARVGADNAGEVAVDGGEVAEGAAAAANGSSEAGPAAGALPDRHPMVLSRPSMDARGHTGYLTFARKMVAPEASAPESGQAAETGVGKAPDASDGAAH